ncbi:hypothetical protein ABR738_37435 [Streptomyces sp. Edi4]|uniref:hypothetical protein n=1 Tax=Streptomyces sp. Edi4 TaxID=3162527 RepID=UPI003305711F
MTQHEPAFLASIIQDVRRTVEPHCLGGTVTPAAQAAAQRLIDEYGAEALADAVAVYKVQLELNKLLR